MSGKPRSAYQKPGRPRPAQPTAAERMERKRQAKEQPKVDYYLAQKAKALSYNYADIPEEHRELVQRTALDIRARQKRAAEDLIAIGSQLLQIKDLLSHGQFRAWWQAEFDYSERMVQGMMRVALIYGDPANPRRVADLSDSALYLLAAPSTPDTVRWEVAERMEMLDFRPTRAQIKKIIDAHKPPRPKQLPPPPVPQLTGPVAEPDPDAHVIEAEYTVIQQDTDQVTLTLTRSLVRKLQAGALRNQRFWDMFTGDELDRLNIIFSKALKDRNE